MSLFTIDKDALTKAIADQGAPDLSGLNYGMLDMLLLWAEREWDRKEKGLPSEWNQGIWFGIKGEDVTGTACGTACCLAGKAISATPGAQWAIYGGSDFEVLDLSDEALVAEHMDESFDDAFLPASIVPEEDRRDYNYVVQNGNGYYRLDASEAGRIILGLNQAEASDLFEGFNKLDDVQRIIADIKAGKYRRTETVTTPVVYVDTVCNTYASDYVNDLTGERVAYTTWGRCTLPEHDDSTEHLFSTR